MSRDDGSGIVYAFVNEDIPNLVKIGQTKHDTIEKRHKGLSSTEVPSPFIVLAAKRVPDRLKTEAMLHRVFAPWRRPRKEWFEITEDAALALFEFVLGEDVAPVLETEINNESEQDTGKKPPPTRFPQLGLKVGDTLYFKSDPSITVEIVNDRQVMWQGDPRYLSGLTLELKHIPNGKVDGFLWWCYDGKTLGELRDSLRTGTP